MQTPSAVHAPEQYDGIQALRFVAALMVVLCHATFYTSERLVADYPVWGKGGSGVDIFFVISGFVMAISSQSLIGRSDGWRTFVSRRVVRIVPLYWMALLLKLAILAVLPSAALHSAADPNSVLASFLFLPSFNGAGELKPFHGVGWTLNFEMFFYAMFALGMALRIQPMKFVLGVFMICCGFAIFRTDAWPALAFYADTIVLEFGFGMLLAHAISRGLKLPVRYCVALIGVGFFGLVHDFFEGDALWRPIVWGIPALMVVTGIACMNEVLRGRVPRWLLGLGAASYALYLFHPLLGPLVPAILAKLDLVSAPLSITLIVLLSIIVTWFIHLWVERPMTASVKNRLAPNPLPTVDQASLAR